MTTFKQTDNEEEYETAEAIENILADREKYKRLAEQNLKDSEEFKNNMCEHRCVKNTEIIELRAKANKYDSLIKEIEDKTRSLNKQEKEELKGTKGQDRYYIKQKYMYQINILQKLLDTEKEKDKRRLEELR